MMDELHLLWGRGPVAEGWHRIQHGGMLQRLMWREVVLGHTRRKVVWNRMSWGEVLLRLHRRARHHICVTWIRWPKGGDTTILRSAAFCPRWEHAGR